MPINKTNHFEDYIHQKVYTLVPMNRFKYKSMIKQGELKIVSMVTQFEINSERQQKNKYGYKILAYTSKNEFYVIELDKSKKQQVQSSFIDDEGISTSELEINGGEDERMVNESQLGKIKNKFMLNTVETF